MAIETGHLLRLAFGRPTSWLTALGHNIEIIV